MGIVETSGSPQMLHMSALSLKKKSNAEHLVSPQRQSQEGLATFDWPVGMSVGDYFN